MRLHLNWTRTADRGGVTAVGQIAPFIIGKRAQTAEWQPIRKNNNSLSKLQPGQQPVRSSDEYSLGLTEDDQELTDWPSESTVHCGEYFAMVVRLRDVWSIFCCNCNGEVPQKPLHFVLVNVDVVVVAHPPRSLKVWRALYTDRH